MVKIKDFKLLWWAFFAILGWAAFCCIEAQVFCIGESGPVQLQLTSDRLVHKLYPFFAETLVICSWQAKLLQKSYGRQMQ